MTWKVSQKAMKLTKETKRLDLHPGFGLLLLLAGLGLSQQRPFERLSPKCKAIAVDDFILPFQMGSGLVCIKILETVSYVLSSALNFMCLDGRYYTLIAFCIHCGPNGFQSLF